VDANASLDSIAPRFAVEEHLDGLLEAATPHVAEDEPDAYLPAACDESLLAENASEEDWISSNGRQRQEVTGVWYRRTADFLRSETDPDASPMKRREGKGSHLGYYAHYTRRGPALVKRAHSGRGVRTRRAVRCSVTSRRPAYDVDRVRSYRGSFPYEKALRRRRVWVEPFFAEAKDRHGMRRFRLRRLEKVNAEALLIAAGQNVKRLLTFGARRPRKIAQAAALRPPRRPSSHAARTIRRCFGPRGTSFEGSATGCCVLTENGR
jgi:hypothetical protein